MIDSGLSRSTIAPPVLKMAALWLSLACVAFASDRMTAPQLIALANSRSVELQKAIAATFPFKDLKAGTARIGLGPEFFFAIETSSTPVLFIDGAAGPQMKKVVASNTWYGVAQIKPVGKLHSYYYRVNDAQYGGTLDLAVLGPLAYLQPGVSSGTLSQKMTQVSKIYDGMKSNYWVYIPSQYDPKIPAALMVFQDGEGYTHRDADSPMLNMIDNLIAQKKIPVIICVFINPGDIHASPDTPTYKFVQAYSEKWHRSVDDSMRSTLYDTVSDRYPRYLSDEILAEVEARYNIRRDAYSRAVTGLSSGGICAFNTAWQMPGQFSRVLTWIGSFTSIQWREDPGNPDGGQDYPDKILHEPKRNLRVWLQDGANDIEWNQYGSWPLANIRMANALKLKEYDFHFSFGNGTHNTAQGTAEFPDELVWLWRDYDPARTEQVFQIDPAEKSRPPFRVAITNRNAD